MARRDFLKRCGEEPQFGFVKDDARLLLPNTSVGRDVALTTPD